MELASGRPAVIAGSMAEAVAVADGRAREGDTVLLSPGCASFDMFRSYEERGRVFRRLVEARLEAARSGAGAPAPAGPR